MPVHSLVLFCFVLKTSLNSCWKLIEWRPHHTHPHAHLTPPTHYTRSYTCWNRRRARPRPLRARRRPRRPTAPRGGLGGALMTRTTGGPSRRAAEGGPARGGGSRCCRPTRSRRGPTPSGGRCAACGCSCACGTWVGQGPWPGRRLQSQGTASAGGTLQPQPAPKTANRRPPAHGAPPRSPPHQPLTANRRHQPPTDPQVLVLDCGDEIMVLPRAARRTNR
jgi:hypothetical protein